ncbi:MAG TPA: GntR family transcriptional regulator [Bacillota bacterium]
MYSLKSKPLYSKVLDSIVAMINDGAFSQDLLPSEDQLSKTLEVSRATVREALARLTREGVITKKQGIGNFIHRSALRAKMRTDIYADFVDLLESAGHVVEVIASKPRSVEADRETRQRLATEADFPLWSFDRLYLADGKPAIWARLSLRADRVNDDLKAVVNERRLRDLLTAVVDGGVAHSVLLFAPAVADPAINERLQVPPGTPMVTWDETFYDTNDRCFGFSVTTFNPAIVRLGMLRKWD